MDHRKDNVFNGSELFIGLIAPTGSDRELVIDQLKTEAKNYGYEFKKITIWAKIPEIISHFKHIPTIETDLTDIKKKLENNYKEYLKNYFEEYFYKVVNGNNGYDLKIITDADTITQNNKNLVLVIKQGSSCSYTVNIFNESGEIVLNENMDLSSRKDLVKEIEKEFSESQNIKNEELTRKIASKLDHRLTNYSTNFYRTLILMKLGTFLRNKIAEEILFYFAIKELHETRNTENTKIMYLFDSIKTPREASLLRTVYGESVSLISIYTKENNREKNIANKLYGDKEEKNKQAKKLIKIDANENDTKGQQVRDTFSLADYFIETSSRSILKNEINRFLSILFNYRFETPRRDEYCMFLAHAASLRSASLSRQVGAAICTTDGSVVSLGCNEVPKYGGGLYWPDTYDYRDHKIGKDTNDEMKADMIHEVLKKLKPIFCEKFSDLGHENFEEKYNDILEDKNKIIPEKLKGSDIRNILEFGRAVHAEMAAITDASMRGIETKNLTLYSTTFPCHICARHIVSSGIKKVLYIEPYPKSKTEILYSDSIAVNPHDELTNRVVFEPYVGISPISYIKYFTSPKNTRKNKSGIIRWDRDNAKVYDLNLMSIDNINKLPKKEVNTAIVAKIGNSYHIRIFDSGGHKIVDKGEGTFSPGEELLNELDETLCMQNDDKKLITDITKRELMQKIISHLEHTHTRLRFKEKDLIYLCREFMVKDITIKNLTYNDNSTYSESIDIIKSIAEYLNNLDSNNEH